MKVRFFTPGRIVFYGGLLLFFGFFLLMGFTRMPEHQVRAKSNRVTADMKAIEYELLSRDSLDLNSIPVQQFNDKKLRKQWGWSTRSWFSIQLRINSLIHSRPEMILPMHSFIKVQTGFSFQLALTKSLASIRSIGGQHLKRKTNLKY